MCMYDVCVCVHVWRVFVRKCMVCVCVCVREFMMYMCVRELNDPGKNNQMYDVYVCMYLCVSISDELKSININYMHICIYTISLY